MSFIISFGILSVIWSIIPHSIGIAENKYVNPFYLLTASIAGFARGSILTNH